MNILKNLGVIVVLIGVAILAVPAFTEQTTNTTLMMGLVLILVGYFGHIFLNKKFE